MSLALVLLAALVVWMPLAALFGLRGNAVNELECMTMTAFWHRWPKHGDREMLRDTVWLSRAWIERHGTPAAEPPPKGVS